ncbi:MAG: ATP-binding protein [Rhodocyclales bacterium]|nr:ATP-binding protein [Rhodocyclales bacterium]
MLYSYAATNFQSFRERVEVNLVVDKHAPDTDWFVTTPSGSRVSKVLGVIGANGSGKTALLKPAAFVAWFISSSFEQAPPGSDIPVVPHFGSQENPTEVECTVDIAGEVWDYFLSCSTKRVVREELYRKRDRGRRYVFKREWDDTKQQYQVKQQDFGLDATKAGEVRPNVSLISWAAQFGVPLALRLASPVVFSNVGVSGRVSHNDFTVLEAAKNFQSQEKLRDQMERLICSWDLGLSGVTIQEAEIVTDVLAPDKKQKFWMPFGKHRSGGKEYQLPFVLESNGTKSAFTLLSILLPALSAGGLAIVDEFESDLHPHMLDAILGLFASPKTNPLNAQLLFTSHAMEVLNILDKTQIMLVEKDDDCQSSAIRLDEVDGVRRDVSLYAKYMAGAFGAVPRF